MKHAVLGAGAIGGIMATGLKLIGEDVVLVVRPEKLSTYPERLTLQQPSATVSTPAHPVTKVAAPVDVLWIATKTFQLRSSFAAVEAMPGIVVPLLNGVDHMSVLRSQFGQERVVAASISVEADRVGEGSFAQRSNALLSVAASGQPVLEGVSDRLHERMGFVCRFVASEATLLWTKLCFLAPLALVSTASRKNKGDIVADPQWKARLYSAIDEAVAVAMAAGAEVSVAKVRTGFDGYGASLRSSMLKDILAERPLELEDIARPLVSGGARYGIPVPTIEALVAAIRADPEAKVPNA